jgi:hypothetical protein
MTWSAIAESLKNTCLNYIVLNFFCAFRRSFAIFRPISLYFRKFSLIVKAFPCISTFEPMVNPTTRPEFPDCSTFLMMSNVPSMAFMCRNDLMFSWYCLQIFLNLYLQFPWPQWLSTWRRISCSTFPEFLYLDFYILLPFVPPLYYIPIWWYW